MLALAAASSTAAANSVGGSIGAGSSYGISVHYQTDRGTALVGSTVGTAGTPGNSALRYGLNLSAVNLSFDQVSVGGSVDYLKDFGTSNLTVRNVGALNPYYGFGLNAGVALGGTTTVGVYPHALAGIRYALSGSLNLFGELNAGIDAAIGSNTTLAFGYGARLGLNYQLR